MHKETIKQSGRSGQLGKQDKLEVTIESLITYCDLASERQNKALALSVPLSPWNGTGWGSDGYSADGEIISKGCWLFMDLWGWGEKEEGEEKG